MLLPSPRSFAPPRQQADPAMSARQPAAASRRSPPPCVFSSPFQCPPSAPKPYIREDHFSGGRPARRAAVRSAGRSAREARLIAEPMSIGRLQLFDLIEDSSHFPAQRRAVVLVDFLEHRAPQPRAGVL